MVAYRYLGSALTNANGVATFDYQGTGAGEIDVIASLDNPITDGSIVSETYQLYDCTFKDTAIQSDYNNTIWSATNCDATRGTEYTELTEHTVGTSFTDRFKGDYAIPNDNMCIEFDVYQVDGANTNTILYLTKSNGTSLYMASIGASNFSVGEWCHFKIELTGANSCKINGSTRTFSSSATETVMFGFTSVSDNTTIRYKNLKVYPI